MVKSLFNKNDDAVAYLTDDHDRTIFLRDGKQVAYSYNERLIYGINEKHPGWFIDGVIFNSSGERIGFTAGTYPVPPSKEPANLKKRFKDKLQPRWKDNPLPKLQYIPATEDLSGFLKNGRTYTFR